MAEKTVKSRIQVKRGTSAQWQEAESNAIKNGKTPFTPYEGEIIFYSDLNKIKIGDGVSILSSLPFLHVDKSEIDSWAHNHDDRYYTESEIDGKISTINTAIGGKAPSSHSHGNIASGGTLGTASMVVVTDGNKKITTSSTISTTELGYLDGVTSKIQDQLNGKSATGHTHDDRYYTESESDARFAPISHNHASNTINAMTGYSKPSSTSAISTSDTLNSAIGKLEKALDGKGTSNLALGTTSTTAAKGDHTHDGRYYTESESDSRFAPIGHTHDVSIAASSGTNELTLAHGTKYALTAGGQSFVFTMPSDTNTWRPVGTGATDAAAGNHTHDGRYYTESESDSRFAPVSHGTHVTAATVKSALGTGSGTSKYLREDGTWVTPPNSNTDAIYSGIGICVSAAATAAKVVTLPKFALATNATILVRVSTTNSATSGVTLNVNSTGAKSIYIGGSAWSTSNQLSAGDYLATYDGTYWKLTRVYLTDNNTDTHYTKYLQIKGNGTEAVKFTQNADKSLNLKPGTNVSISAASGEITISATDTNTTYTIATGDNNGQIKVTPSSGSAYNVAVKGLGTAAYETLYKEAECTTFTSDSGTCTPKAIQKGAKMFAYAGTLTSYKKASSVSAVSASDTISAAIGKLEKALDSKADDSDLGAQVTYNFDSSTGTLTITTK